MDLSVTQGSRQSGVDLQHDEARRLDDVLLVGDAQGQGNKAVFVGRGAGTEKNIGPARVDAVAGRPVEHVGHEGDRACLVLQGLAGTWRMEPAGEFEVSPHVRLHVEVVGFQREAGKDPHILHAVGDGVEAGHATLRLGGAHGDDHIVVAADMRGGFVRADELASIEVLTVHRNS